MTEAYSPNALSIQFAVDRAVAVKALKHVTPDRMEKGLARFTVASFARALEQHHLRNASNANDGGGASESSSLTAARTRIANASATAKERANLVAAGLLCPIEDVGTGLGLALQVLNEHLLAVPARVSERILERAPGADRDAVFQIVQSEIYDGMRAVQASAKAITAGLADSAAKGVTYRVAVNSEHLGAGDGQ
jgi:hypothetical protein